MVPTDRGRIDKALNEIGPLLDQITPGFDQCRISVETAVSEQKYDRLETALFFHRVGLRRRIALHGRILVGEERLCIECIGPYLRFAEAEIGLEPLEIAGHSLLRHEQRARFE